MTPLRGPLLKSIALEGFLSFGPARLTLPLQPLNVLIGPNGAGKSNLVEAFAVLRAAPQDLPLPIRRGGAVRDWLWKGPSPADRACLEVVFSEGHIAQLQTGTPAVRYRLVFGAEGPHFVVLDERIEHETGSPKPYFYFGYENGRPMVNIKDRKRALRREDIDPSQSILAQRRDPESYPELSRISDALRKIKIYRSWSFGPDSPLRRGCGVDQPSDVLGEDMENLPVIVQNLLNSDQREPLIRRFCEAAPGMNDLQVRVLGNQLHIYAREDVRETHAARLSDGTLRHLSLLAILLNAKASPLIILEEPELGLHPDLMPGLRDLLVEASKVTQLVVTTHSTVLVDAMTELAGSVLITDRVDGGSSITALSQEQVDRWSASDSLGAQWMAGRLGGTRW
jgi:predicted ATPase